MEDVRDLKESQLDAIREVANIGAGHAATALSGMTNKTIMITVPRVYVRPLEEACDLVGAPDAVIAAVLPAEVGPLHFLAHTGDASDAGARKPAIPGRVQPR